MKLDDFLDNLNEKAIQALVWIGVVMWVVIFAAAGAYVVFDLGKEDVVVGYTDHGLPVTQQDIEKWEKENEHDE
jgi:hypothetical protein